MMAERHETIEKDARSAWDERDYQRAATVLLRGYGRELFGFLVVRLRDRETAREVFSLLAEDLWRGLERFEWRSSARGWLYTLARHAADRHQKQARRQRARNVPLSDVSLPADLAERVRTDTAAYLRTAVKTRIAALRERLPHDDQMLLVLRVKGRLEWKEIARVLGDGKLELDEDALVRRAARLRKRFQLVKDRLREMAEKEGLLGD